MTSISSYLFKAFYDWMRDNGANPRILVDANEAGVVVPREYVSNGVILISICYLYVSNFEIGPNKISFFTRFKGQKEFVSIPYTAMIELICSDNGLTIPLSMWLASIDLACHQYDEPNGADEPEKAADLGKQEEPSPKIRFTLDESSESADGTNPFVNEDQDDGNTSVADDEGATSTASKSKSRAAKAPKKSKPSFTVLD